MVVVAYSPCFTVLSDKFDEYNCSWLIIWLWLPYCCLCTSQNKKISSLSGLSVVQHFGYLLMKYPLSPETGLALLQPLWSKAAGELLRQAHCCCWELLSSLTLMQAQLTARHFPALLLMTGSSAEFAWDTPGLSSLFFWCIQIHPLAKTRNNNGGFCLLSNSLGRSLHTCKICSCLLQHVCQSYLQAAQGVWWDVWHWASSPFPFICPVVPTRVWWCSCPGNTRFPLQPSFSLPHIFDDSIFCLQVLLCSPSHCRRKDTCSVIKLSPTCRQVLRSVCGCAVTHISWDADVF